MALKNLANNFYFNFNLLQGRLNHLEENLLRIEEKLDRAIEIQRNHLIRLKNGEDLTDDFFFYDRTYRDLTPQRAFELYNRKNYNFIVLDVSDPNYTPACKLPEAINLTLEQIPSQHQRELNFITPIFVISEDGTKSILACELLVTLGYYNVNNVSGGHKFWPGQHQQNQNKAA